MGNLVRDAVTLLHLEALVPAALALQVAPVLQAALVPALAPALHLRAPLDLILERDTRDLDLTRSTNLTPRADIAVLALALILERVVLALHLAARAPAIAATAAMYTTCTTRVTLTLNIILGALSLAEVTQATLVLAALHLAAALVQAALVALALHLAALLDLTRESVIPSLALTLERDTPSPSLTLENTTADPALAVLVLAALAPVVLVLAAPVLAALVLVALAPVALVLAALVPVAPVHRAVPAAVLNLTESVVMGNMASVVREDTESVVRGDTARRNVEGRKNDVKKNPADPVTQKGLGVVRF